MTSLSIVLLTYNRQERLKRTLDQLLPQCGEREVLVCDNASTDGTQSLMTQIAASHPNLRYRRNAINVGYARNLFGGFIAARGSHVLFLADDDIIPYGFLSELDALVAAHAQAGVIIPNRRRTDNSGAMAETLRDQATEFHPPSRQAVETAFVQSGAVPGLVVRVDAVRATDWQLDGTIYPQIGLASHLAAREGLVTARMVHSIICLESDGIASRIKDAMNRPSDYGLIERARIAERLAAHYPALLGDADLLKRSLWDWAFDVFDEMRRAGIAAHAREIYLPALLRCKSCGQSASFMFLWLKRSRQDSGFLGASLSPMLRYLPGNLASRRFFRSLFFWLKR